MGQPLPFDPIAEACRQWNARWRHGPTPSMSAVTSIMRVEQILMARLNHLLDSFDLTFPRYEALMLLYLSRRGSLPLGKMGARLQVHRTSVTNLIDGLERSGYARRVPHEQDRRTTLAEITERGREVAEASTEILNRERFGTAPLKRSELEAISELLQRLRKHADGFEEGPDQRATTRAGTRRSPGRTSVRDGRRSPSASSAAGARTRRA